ncbi:hypothetical protein J5N97_015296 [Dioscorea zingiberensis]|uniref:Uncharacterized protein n=1 Tax=Dioscorea zingiberensis TaxID=325984 RepID=A0A9D5CVL5_9LILI|nr:hypothetical protein J5N97_015296 [Dioscorea zingiberensis]
MGCKLSTSRTAVNVINASSSMVRTRDDLQDTAAELLGINVDSSIQLKRELSSNAELLQLVQVQLKRTMEGVRCLDNLKYFLTKLGRDMQVLPFLEDGTNGAEVLQKVKDIKAILGDRAAMRLTLEDYNQSFSRQSWVLNELHLRRNSLDHRLRRVKAWRKAWNIVYSTVKFGVIVLSVVLAVLTAPPAATATANGTGGVLALLQQWVDSKWDDHQSSCEAERELTGKILNEASLTFHEVNQVRVLLRHLEVQIASLTHHAEFSIEDDEDPAAGLVVERMKQKAADVMASVESLEEEVDRRRVELKRTALTFLWSVTDQVGNFDINGESNNIPVGYEN